MNCVTGAAPGWLIVTEQLFPEKVTVVPSELHDPEALSVIGPASGVPAANVGV